MLYAILAYHVEAEVMSWTPQDDAALMTGLHKVHDRLTREGRLGAVPACGPDWEETGGHSFLAITALSIGISTALSHP